MILYNFTAAKIVNFFYSKPFNVVSYSSKLLEDAVNELSRLPGIGKRTALRLALHLMKEDIPDVEALGNAVIRLRTELNYCKNCHNISDEELCNICSSPKRDKKIICVIEDIRDIMAIENTGQFNGVYHVLGGIISPIEGIAPHDLNIDSLIKKLESNSIEEIILALPTTIEGDTTNFYLFKKINSLDIKISVIARGIAIGDDLEFADEITLGRSIINRVPYADKA